MPYESEQCHPNETPPASIEMSHHSVKVISLENLITICSGTLRGKM